MNASGFRGLGMIGSGGVSRNFQVFDALEFLVEVTAHIPDRGKRLIHYLGWYSDKERGVLKKMEPSSKAKADGDNAEADAFLKQPSSPQQQLRGQASRQRGLIDPMVYEGSLPTVQGPGR